MSYLSNFTKSQDLVHSYDGSPPWEPAVLFISMGFQVLLFSLNVFTVIWLKTAGRGEKVSPNLSLMTMWSSAYAIGSIAYLGARYRDFFILRSYFMYTTPAYVMYVVMMAVHFSMIGVLMLSWMEIIHTAQLKPPRNWKFVIRFYVLSLWVSILISYTVSAILFLKAPDAAGIVMVFCLSGFIALFTFVLLYFIYISRQLLRAVQDSKITPEGKARIKKRFMWLASLFIACLVSQIIYLIFTVTNPFTGDPALFYPMLMLPMYISALQAVLYYSPVSKLIRQRIRFLVAISMLGTSSFSASVDVSAVEIVPEA